jgi:hypothetical protein
MYRRRRQPAGEPVFSFDSFLDLVTNVVGIIIRLILVAWVSARAYSSLKNAMTEEPAAAELRTPKQDDDPLNSEVARVKDELAQARARLLEQMRAFGDLQASKAETSRELEGVAAESARLRQTSASLKQTLGQAQGNSPALPDLAELRQRGGKLKEEIRALEKSPLPKKALRYHAPVSRPVHAEELMFECKGGRVTFIDLGALIEEMKGGLSSKAEQLKDRWSVSDVAGPVGAFRLRYTAERQRALLEGSAAPLSSGSFRYAVSEWVLEPIASLRGETFDQALAPRSEFRHVIEGQELSNTVITFWVYPDSFPLLRQLRDYLYERGAEVAARPLPEGQPIAAARNGTTSRGQ